METKEDARFPGASVMYISPGNIINYHNLKKDIPRTSTDELKVALQSALTSPAALNDDAVSFTTPGSRIARDCCDDTMDSMKITVKIMLNNAEAGMVTEAVIVAMKELEVKKLDNVLLSMPAAPFDEDLTMDHFRPVWAELETLVQQDKIKTLGVCDLDLTMLKELHSLAQVPPTTNQLNQVSCCVIPPELKEFANENMIQLVAHSDQSDMLPAVEFQEVLRSHYPSSADSCAWHPSWVLRYTALIKNRGIITTKGYILRAQRVLPLDE